MNPAKVPASMNEQKSPDPAEVQRRRILAWRSGHGLVMLAATGLAFFMDLPELISGAALLSLLVLGKTGSVPREPGARFNYATMITALRILLGATLILTPAYLGPAYAAAQLVLLWVLDVLDGILARSLQTVTVLGGNLDKEADAFITLNACVALMQFELVGPWILIIGLIRYAYLLLLGLARRVSKSPRAPLSNFTTGYTHVVLGLGFVLDANLRTVPLMIATVLILISYGRAVYHAFR
jgi:phosphatidylglycerophosphate synthase